MLGVATDFTRGVQTFLLILATKVFSCIVDVESLQKCNVRSQAKLCSCHKVLNTLTELSN